MEIKASPLVVTLISSLDFAIVRIDVMAVNTALAKIGNELNVSTYALQMFSLPPIKRNYPCCRNI